MKESEKQEGQEDGEDQDGEEDGIEATTEKEESEWIKMQGTRLMAIDDYVKTGLCQQDEGEA